MPIYEYQCQACQHRLETLQRISEPPLTTCPDCGGELRKLLSAPAFQFKGSGWYVTDYARKDGGGKSGDEKPREGKAGDSGAEKPAKAKGSAEGAGSGKSGKSGETASTGGS